MELYSWGANSYGQLVLGNTVDQSAPTKSGNCSLQVQQLVAGGGHSLFQSSDNQWFSCGSNSSGQLGLPGGSGLGLSAHVEAPLKINFADHGSIKQCYCGWDFTFILTNHGRLFACGSNSFGQLGLPLVSTKIAEPTAASSLLQDVVVDVSCGLRHTVALTKNGQVYCCGSSKKGALGISSSDLNSNVPIFTKVDLSTRGKVVQVVAGAYHSIARTDSGEVFVWGDNKHGQLALDPAQFKTILAAAKIPQQYFKDEPITQIYSGWTHVIAVTATNKVYSWGRNDLHQLGRNPDVQQTFRPEVIDFAASPSQLAIGSEHNLAIVDDRLYSWGWNEHGICGTGDEINVKKPQIVQTLKDKSCSSITCGAGHSFAICTS